MKASAPNPASRELEAILSEEAGRHDGGCRAFVSDSSGALEVRITGPKASLRLVFERAELDPAQVRHVVRRTLSRYRSALSARQGKDTLGKEQA